MSLNVRYHADARVASAPLLNGDGEFAALNDNSPTATNHAANDNVAHGAVTLHQGCCLEVMKAIPARSVHLILADLPYGTTACSWDSIIDLGNLWEEYRRVITPTGVIVLTAAYPFTVTLGASNLGWLKESLVWEKSRATGFLQSKKRHLKKHEDILVFSPGTVVSGKGRQTARNMTYNPQGLVELERPVRSRNGNMKGGTLNYSGGHNTLSPIYRPCYIKPNTKRNGEPSTFNGKPITGDGRNQTHTNYPTSILRFASERKTVHPTQKPVALMEYLVRTYSNDGDTVLDNCMGSGTTGVACANVGNRNFIGIERDPQYFAIAETRIAAAHDQLPEPPPIPVAANDDAPAVGPDEQDEIVRRVQAVIAAPKRTKGVKVPAWKVRVQARKAGRKEVRRGNRLERQAQPPEIRNDPVEIALVPMMTAVKAVTPPLAGQQLAANDNPAVVTITLCNSVIKTDVVAGVKKLPDRSIDIIISDPPYNIGKDFGSCKDKMAMDEYIAWCNDWIAEGMRVLKPTGTFYIYGFSEILAFLFVHSKADFKRWLVWHYTNKNSVKSTFWQRSHESILVLSHQDPHFNVDAAREPYSEAYKGQVGRTRKGTPGRFGNTESLYGGHPGGAQGRDVIKHPALAGGAGAKERVAWCETCSKLLVGSKEKAAHKGHKLTEHETQKPIGLTRRLIAAAKNPEGVTNAVVLFSGTGAESVALAQEGCKFVAFDINDTYVKLGNAWIERVAPKPKEVRRQAQKDALPVTRVAGGAERLAAQDIAAERPRAPASAELHPAANDHDVVRYATICSGIEGVSAAVEPLGGFKTEFFSDKAEYSPFATAFLKWKFPHVTYIDDFTTIDGSAYRGKVDVLWGSTPCQTWSKAGKNAGLADDRGQLTLNFINLVNEIQPQFTIWENVKNVLSHKEAFGQFLGTLAGEDCNLLPAGKKWENAGYVRGPDRQVAWRVFDAEYAGLAARRERVFLVATPVGGADPRDILWERDNPPDGGGHPEAGRGAWERIEGEKVRLRTAGGGAGGSEGPFAFNADTSPKSSEIGLTLRADTASGGFQGIAFRDENGPRAFRLTPEMMERMLGFPQGWTDMGDAWTGRGRLDIRRGAALGNSLAVPDVRWILERVKASVQGTLEMHHWPEPDAANDNSADGDSAKVTTDKRRTSCGGSRLKTKFDTKVGLGDFEMKFKSLPTEKWDWAA